MADDGPSGLNEILVSGNYFLLVETAGGGRAVHLASVAESDAAARGAIPDAWLGDDEWLGRFDLDARYDIGILAEPRWSARTLCGREWLDMAGGGGGPLTEHGLDAVAPSCRRCLASLDRWFPAVEPDDRIQLLSQLATEAVNQVGSAMVTHVPGDQMEPLRRAVRTAIRERLGYRSNTVVTESTLHVWCDEAFEVVRESQMNEVAATLERAFAGIEPTADPDHVISWRTVG